MKKKKKIYLVTVGRSDFLRQLSIIENLIDKKIDLKIIITGSHSKKFLEIPSMKSKIEK